jgi:hypothetical protein
MRLAEPSGWRLPAEGAVRAVVGAVHLYAAEGRDGETFSAFIERVGADALRAAGEDAP